MAEILAGLLGPKGSQGLHGPRGWLALHPCCPGDPCWPNPPCLDLILGAQRVHEQDTGQRQSFSLSSFICDMHSLQDAHLLEHVALLALEFVQRLSDLLCWVAPPLWQGLKVFVVDTSIGMRHTGAHRACRLA